MGKRKTEQYGTESKRAGGNRLAYIPGILGGIRNRGHELGWEIRTEEGVIRKRLDASQIHGYPSFSTPSQAQSQTKRSWN